MNNLRRDDNFGMASNDPRLTREGYIIDIANRFWAQTNLHSLFQTNGTAPWSFKDRENIPDAVKQFYKGIDRKTRRTSNYIQPLAIIDVKKELDKYKIDGAIAGQFARCLASRVPETLNSLSDETVSRFMKVLPGNKRDLSVIYILPTNGEEKTSRWGDIYFIANEYIITDKNLNPIDPNKFMSVMKKIIVDK